MARSDVLVAPEDLTWLAETHLQAFAALLTSGAFPVVRLIGNEDCPDHLDLYSENRYDAPYLRISRAEDGSYTPVGIQFDCARGGA